MDNTNLVIEIMKKGIELSQNTKADVFVSYSGHVDWVTVSVYVDGHREDAKNYDFSKYIYLSDIKGLESILNYLNNL